ncbi:MAG: hypothetical protein LBV50_11985 [Novosphingobium sp.]|nr:hypothetical protein [Novosphingobium sp.]
MLAPALALVLALFAAGAAAQPAAGPPSPADECLAGDYDGSAMEMAGGLHLESGGRFRYVLSYGAVDETAAGRWERDTRHIYLTSDPVTPARFSLVGEGPAPAGEFRVALDLPRGISRQYFNVMLILADGRTIARQMSEDGLIIPLEPGENVASIRVLLPVFDLESERFAITAGTASEARLRFEPNDLGTVAFAHQPLAIEGSALVLQRYDREIRFSRGEGKCGR